MSQCTCTTDKEATCIVHPTTRSLKDYIAKLEAENIRLKRESGLLEKELRGEMDSLRWDIMHLREDCDRLRKELDESNGVIR